MGYRLGIDLGTTFTAAAYVEDQDQTPRMLDLGNRNVSVPSVLLVAEDGHLLFGEAAERRAAAQPQRVIREFKRRFGDDVPIMIDNRSFDAVALQTALLDWVLESATRRLAAPPDHVVVTHPANWGPYKMQLMRNVLAGSGIPTAALCPEPVAAAIAYTAKNRVPDGAKIAVYDLGGGTFDVAVLEKAESSFTILGTPLGIEHLGGSDFDEAVFAEVLGRLGVTDLDFDDPATGRAILALRRDCIEAKESLSSDDLTQISSMLPGAERTVRLTRPEFESLIQPSLEDSMSTTTRALRLAGVNSSDLYAIVLVGGSSRIPLVTEMLNRSVQAPVAVDTYPKNDIALGAARYSLLAGGPPAGATAPTPTPTTIRTAPAIVPPGLPTAPVVAPRISSPPAAQQHPAQGDRPTAPASFGSPSAPTGPQSPTYQNASGQNPTGPQSPTYQNPSGQNPIGQNASSQHPTGQNPTSQNPTSQNPISPPAASQAPPGPPPEWLARPPADAIIPPDQAGDTDQRARRRWLLPVLLVGGIVVALGVASGVIIVRNLSGTGAGSTAEQSSVPPSIVRHPSPSVSVSPSPLPSPSPSTSVLPDPVEYGLPVGAPLPIGQLLAPRAPKKATEIRRLWLLDVSDPSKAHRVKITAAANVSGIGMSPDRRTITYNDRAANAIRAASSEGGDVKLLYKAPKGCGTIHHASWSATDLSVFVLECQIGNGRKRLVVTRINGSVITELDVGYRHAADPTISPNGRLVAFWAADTLDAGDGGAIVIVPIDGSGSAKNVTKGKAGGDSDPAWSPDGRSLAFRRTVGGPGSADHDILVVSSSGGKTRTVMTGKANDQKPTFSPDGNSIVVVSNRDTNGNPTERQDLWQVPTTGGRPVSLGFDSAGISTPTWWHR